MYRAVTWLSLQEGVDLDDRAGRRGVVGPRRNGYRDGSSAAGISINGVDVSEAIRAPEVSAAVSAIATNLDVRADLLHARRSLIADAVGGIVARGPRHHDCCGRPTLTYVCCWLLIRRRESRGGMPSWPSIRSTWMTS
jgi:cytidylate kinase